MAPSRRKSSQVYSNCTTTELIRGGKEYFEKILSLIKSAEKSIHLQTYIFEEDQTGRLVADALKAAAKRKVAVYMMLDGYASQALSKKFIASLEDAGVHFRFFEPLLKSRHFYFGRRMHHKILVVDEKYAITGSKNISNRYNDMPHTPSWLDFNLYIEGEIAGELCAVCAKTWNGFRLQARRVRYKDGELAPVTGKRGLQARIRLNDWVRRKNQISATYTEMLRNADSHITILCSYFLPGTKFRQLMQRATRRGVDIKVIVAGKSDVMVSKNAERWLYDWMLRNKIAVYEYEPSVLHAKAAACDGEWVTIGSYNINNISAYASIELNVDVRSKPFTKEVEQVLKNIIKNECVEVTAETHIQTKNVFKQFVRWLSYQSIRVLFHVVTFYYRQTG